MMRLVPLLLTAAFSLCGTPIDVSGASSVLVRTGDTLSFDIFTFGFAQNAGAFGVSPDPTAIDFALVTSPLLSGSQFAATISSLDASIELAFGGPFGFTDGYLSRAGFQGAVSTLQGHLNLTSTISQDLFGAGMVRLSLKNQGADLTLGLSPLTVAQTAFVSLSGGPLTVGAYAVSATLNPQDLALRGDSLELLSESVPEPGSSWLLMGGGVLLCAISRLINLSRQRAR